MPRVVPVDSCAASPPPAHARLRATALAACRALLLLAVVLAAGAAALAAAALAHDAPLAAALAAAGQRAAAQRPRLARYVRLAPAAAGAAPCLFVGRFRTPLCLPAVVAPADAGVPADSVATADAVVAAAAAEGGGEVECGAGRDEWEDGSWLIHADGGGGGCSTCGIEHLAT